MSLAELIEELRGCVIDGNPSVEITGITHSSREVTSGTLFVAIKGFKADGHDYVSDAIERGAVAVVVERDVEAPLDVCKVRVPDSREALSHISSAFYGNPSKKLEIIGITGTNGKTTTCYLLRSIYEAAGIRCGMLTTIEYWIGSTKKRGQLTTPESLDMQRILGKMVEGGVKALAMEVSSHGLALRRVKDVEFAKGVFTNISRDHLDFHIDMENYISSKKSFFRGLRAGSIAVLNCDDPCWEEMASVTQARVVKYGFAGNADFRGRKIRATIDGTQITASWKKETAEIKSHLIGRHNAHNMLASAATAAYSGLDKEAIIAGIRNVRRIPGRLEPFRLRNGGRAFVDYAHTPDALKRVLESLREVTQGNLICVFGCGGDRDRGKRPIMGEVSTNLADFTIVTSDNPRSEDPKTIIEEITRGAKKGNFRTEVDRRKAIEEAVALAKPDDAVLVAGKGHERFQTIGDAKIPFDDGKVLSSLIGKGN